MRGYTVIHKLYIISCHEKRVLLHLTNPFIGSHSLHPVLSIRLFVFVLSVILPSRMATDKETFSLRLFSFDKVEPRTEPLRKSKSQASHWLICLHLWFWPDDPALIPDLLFTVPRPRSGHRIICDEHHNIFSFGGYNPVPQTISEGTAEEEGWDIQKPLFRDLWHYDCVTRTWNKVRTEGAHPEQLASHAATIHRDHLVVYGGTGVPFGESSSNKIHACKLRTGVWEWIRPENDPNDEIPTDQYGQAIVVDAEANCMYAVGGTTGFAYTIDVYKFDFFTRKWHLLWKRTDSNPDTFPEQRYRHEVVLYDNKLYVFGGGTDQRCYGFKIIPVFDLSTCSWTRLKTNPKSGSRRSIPAPRKHHGCVKTSDNQVFIMGGSDGQRIFRDVWKFDLTTDTWQSFAIDMPSPLYFHGMTISPVGKVTIFGGVNRMMVNPSDTNVRTNDMYEIWLQTPPLEEMAWLAFVSYCDTNLLTQCSRSDLSKMGIPTKFINRLQLKQSCSTVPQVKSACLSEKNAKAVPQPS